MQKMKKNPANELKDVMWTFLMDGGQKENIPALKEYVYDLIKATTQKDAGQRGNKDNIDFNHVDMIMFSILYRSKVLKNALF